MKMDFLSSGKSRIRSELPGSNSTAGSARQALGLLVPEDKTGEVAAEEVSGNYCEIEPQDGP